MTYKKVGPSQPASILLGSIMDRFGNTDTIRLGGGVVFQTNNGPYLEYTVGLSNNALCGEDLEVFRTHIEPNVISQFKIEADEIVGLCSHNGFDLKSWIKRAKSKDLRERALCIVDIGSFCGWDIIDEDPLILNTSELYKRWHPKWNKDTPVTTKGCFKPHLLVPQLLQALISTNPQKYWDLMGSPFPIIPARAMQDKTNPWWDSFGSSACNKIVEVLNDSSPEGWVFEVRDEQFGFWKTKDE